MKTAIIGLGPHGLRLVKCIEELSAYDLVAVVDKQTATFNKLPSQNEIVCYTELDELFANHQLDVVVIATNGPSHHPISIKAMEHGVKKLFISKPLACSIEDARAIATKSFDTNTRIVVDHGLRHDVTYQWIRARVFDKTYGDLKSIYIQRPGIGLGCLGVHSFDLANYLIGENPLTVSGWVDEPVLSNPRGVEFVDPGGLVVLNYPSGVRSTILQIEDGCGPMSVELVFNYARIKVDEKFRTMEVISKDPSFKPSPGNPVKFEKEINPHDVEVKHDIFYLMKALLKELISTDEISAGVENGIMSVEILAAAYQSEEQGNVPVSLPVSSHEFISKFLPVT